MPDSIEVGTETNIMFPINNTGKVTLYNVTAIFEADSIQRAESYVGNIKPGESGNVDVMVAGAAPTMDGREDTPYHYIRGRKRRGDAGGKRRSSSL